MEFPLIALSPPVRVKAALNHRFRNVSSTLLARPRIAWPTSRGGRPIHFYSGAADAHSFMAEALRDGGAAALVMAGGYSLVLVFDNLARRNLIEQSLSRKIVHVLSGICYMATWPIFSSSSGARYFAAVVPLLNCIRLLIYGLSIVPNESVIKSVTREGKPEYYYLYISSSPCALYNNDYELTIIHSACSRELLRGPLYYVLVLMISSLIFWRESPIGIISLAMMSGGDGFADILGRRFGSMKLPYNKRKSWIGSISMFMFGFIFSTMMLHYFSAFGYLHLDWGSTVEKLLVVSLAASFMESLPISEVIDDNITVPLTSMAAAFMVFGY